MRALAAGSILVHHCWLYGAPDARPAALGTLGGVSLDHLAADLAYGVTVFFALSGFLLYRQFAAALLRLRELPNVRTYLRRRALRILPAYWVILLVVSISGAALVRVSPDQLVPNRHLSAGVLAQDAALVQNYHPSGVLTGIGPAWSLAIEVVFYLTLPLLAAGGLLLARRMRGRRGIHLAALAPPALLLLVGLSGRAAAMYLVPGGSGWGGNWHSVVERSFWCHADLFAFGMALAVLHVEVADGRVRLPRWWPAAAAGVAVGGYALVATQEHPFSTQLGASYWNTLMGAVSAALVALVAFGAVEARRSRLVALLASRPLAYAGLISYSVFLWHEPVVRFLSGHGLTQAGRGGFVVNLLELAAATAILSTISYRLVELPALRRKRGGRRKHATTAAEAAP